MLYLTHLQNINTTTTNFYVVLFIFLNEKNYFQMKLI